MPSWVGQQTFTVTPNFHLIQWSHPPRVCNIIFVDFSHTLLVTCNVYDVNWAVILGFPPVVHDCLKIGVSICNVPTPTPATSYTPCQMNVRRFISSKLANENDKQCFVLTCRLSMIFMNLCEPVSVLWLWLWQWSLSPTSTPPISSDWANSCLNDVSRSLVTGILRLLADVTSIKCKGSCQHVKVRDDLKISMLDVISIHGSKERSKTNVC